MPHFGSLKEAQRAQEMIHSARGAEEKEIAVRKLTPAEVLYMEDGGEKRCGRCMMYLTDTKQCSIIGEEVNAEDGVCGLYVHGKPMTMKEHGPAMKLVSKEVAGYGEDKGMGGYSCGNCRYGGNEYCKHPFLDEPKIDNVGGCCNIWDYSKSEETKR